ncbi:hypothetical protein [Microtetraspora malaysiensis]|uniref:hypothetical protein n=1 Tax=Microtetraspora malaysiensis TaxID=161358 RepID=UPI00082FAF19|nr:hypothetical protein [Microtetraspora malaysiensis]
MNYAVNFHASASSQIPGLPAEAFRALVDELLIVGADPHHRGFPDPDDPRYREQVFGAVGLVSYLIDDAAKVVHVYAITWAG